MLLTIDILWYIEKSPSLIEKNSFLHTMPKAALNNYMVSYFVS